MLLLGEGDVEWQIEDQVTLATPADPNCPDTLQRGKSWITRKAYGMWSDSLFHPRHLSTDVSLPNEFVSRLITEILMAQVGRGGDVLQGLQSLDHGLWDHPAIDPNSCGVVAIFAPMGPWAQSKYSSPLPCSLLFCVRIAIYINLGTNAPNRRKP